MQAQSTWPTVPDSIFPAANLRQGCQRFRKRAADSRRGFRKSASVPPSCGKVSKSPQACRRFAARFPKVLQACRGFAARFPKVRRRTADLRRGFQRFRRRAAKLRQGFRKSASVPPSCGKVSNDSAGVPRICSKVSESEKHTRTNSMKKTEKTRTFEPEFKQ